MAYWISVSDIQFYITQVSDIGIGISYRHSPDLIQSDCLSDVVCYRAIVAPYVRSVVMSLHSITFLKTIWNVQWTMSSLYTFPELRTQNDLFNINNKLH